MLTKVCEIALAELGIYARHKVSTASQHRSSLVESKRQSVGTVCAGAGVGRADATRQPAHERVSGENRRHSCVAAAARLGLVQHLPRWAHLRRQLQ